MPAKKSMICALDIGTSKIVTIVGQKKESGEVEVSGVGLTDSNGVRKGMITDIEETISAISASLEEAERMAGVPLEKAIISVGGVHISSTNSKGVIAVSRADGEISEEDVVRAIEAAKAVSLPANREILHVIPRVYSVDGQEGIKDPIGMTGIRLEVEAHVISGSTPCIKNLTKCVYQAGLDIDNLVFSGLATAAAFLGKQQKEIGIALVDIGAATTTVAVFEEGSILHSAVLPIGADHITNDIAIGLRISIDAAEKVKLKHGKAVTEDIRESEEIDLSKIDKTEKQKASPIYVAEIIEARLQEIFSLISDELKNINRDAKLPAGIVLTGGGANLPQITDAAKENLKLPAQIGKPQVELAGLVDKLQDPRYSCGIGLLVWGVGSDKKEQMLKTKTIEKATSRVKQWFKHLLP